MTAIRPFAPVRPTFAPGEIRAPFARRPAPSKGANGRGEYKANPNHPLFAPRGELAAHAQPAPVRAHP